MEEGREGEGKMDEVRTRGEEVEGSKRGTARKGGGSGGGKKGGRG